MTADRPGPRTRLAEFVILHLWRHPKHNPDCEGCRYIKGAKR